jgi:hypothetical protein
LDPLETPVVGTGARKMPSPFAAASWRAECPWALCPGKRTRWSHWGWALVKSPPGNGEIGHWISSFWALKPMWNASKTGSFIGFQWPWGVDASWRLAHRVLQLNPEAHTHRSPPQNGETYVNIIYWMNIPKNKLWANSLVCSGFAALKNSKMQGGLANVPAEESSWRDEQQWWGWRGSSSLQAPSGSWQMIRWPVKLSMSVETSGTSPFLWTWQGNCPISWAFK